VIPPANWEDRLSENGLFTIPVENLVDKAQTRLVYVVLTTSAKKIGDIF
jgi:hypothetical protein